jgi:GNAT superfamily N-acetyltransferase
MIRLCREEDFEQILAIINDGARAYKGVIPPDRWSDPYMSKEELQTEVEDGVVFWGFAEGGDLQGVMGLQPVQDVTLIRHAYVRAAHQGQGIGSALLTHLKSRVDGPVLVGTWADAVWAIRLYERFGFELVNRAEKERLLKKYWNIPERQVETSVVLADSRWRQLQG